MPKPRIALIHDWLTGMRGGEKVLEILCELFPTADLFTLIHDQGKVSPRIERHRIITSPLQYFPMAIQRYRHYLPLMPWAIEQMDFRGYDALISTSHCVAKGSIPPAGVPHISYCHTPMRYIWDQFPEYFGPGKASWPVRLAMQLVRGRLQKWDLSTSSRVTRFIANSRNVQERIQRIYHRESEVIYPPVDYTFFSQRPEGEERERSYFLIVSALAPYKRVDLAIQAFRRLRKPLLIIGDGQEEKRLRAIADGAVQFLGWRDNEALRDAYAGAKALIFPGVEDFGIVPLEAMAAGIPVIAYAKGGALETVVDGRTGLFFNEQTPEALMEAVDRFEMLSWDPMEARAQARKFSREACMEAFRRTFFAQLS